MHIGIFGGTFDPIHVGHCHLAWELYHACSLDEIRFIPNATPVHRAAPGASAEQRAQMIQLAIQDFPAFVLDRREIDRTTPSYMVETLSSLRESFPNAALSLILGVDAFAKLTTWYEYERLLTLAHLIVCDRPNTPILQGAEAALFKRLATDDLTQLSAQSAGKIFFFKPKSVLSIASTELRNLISHQQVPKFLLSPLISDYIIDNGLYQSKGEN